MSDTLEHVGPDAVGLRQVLRAWEHLKVRFAVQPAYALRLQRDDMVDVVHDAGQSANALGSSVNALHDILIGPGRNGILGSSIASGTNRSPFVRISFAIFSVCFTPFGPILFAIFGLFFLLGLFVGLLPSLQIFSPMSGILARKLSSFACNFRSVLCPPRGPLRANHSQILFYIIRHVRFNALRVSGVIGSSLNGLAGFTA